MAFEEANCHILYLLIVIVELHLFEAIYVLIVNLEYVLFCVYFYNYEETSHSSGKQLLCVCACVFVSSLQNYAFLHPEQMCLTIKFDLNVCSYV